MSDEREVLFSARKKDFRIDKFRASGKGGQHRNKTDSAVRITHIESGMSSECTTHRSQHKNKREAFRKLVKKLISRFGRKEARARFAAGQKTVRSYHEPNDRVTDHDSGKTYSYRHTVGKGDLSELIADRRQFMSQEK